MTKNIIEFAGYSICIETITPAIAAKMLLKNSCNRAVRPGIVSAYSTDMENGNWLQKPVPICVMPDGSIGNGQHTLLAIVKSGTTQTLLVARNVSPDIISVMDIGAKRSINDVAHFLQLDVDQRRIAVARAVESGLELRPQTRSFAYLYDVYLFHQEAVEFAVGLVKAKKRGMAAPVISVLAKAWYTKDRSRLQEFARIFLSGEIAGPEDTAALRLRDAAQKLGAGYSQRLDLYQKTMTALDAFLKRQPLQKIYASTRDLFPSPTMDNQRKAA